MRFVMMMYLKFVSFFQIKNILFSNIIEIVWFLGCFKFEEIKNLVDVKEQKFDFIVNNFEKICRFCLKEVSGLQLIFNDQTEESTNDSNIFIEKINSTLFEVRNGI